jgi:hypothetical protein
MVMHTYNPSNGGGEAWQENYKFKASLGYTMRPCIKAKQNQEPV